MKIFNQIIPDVIKPNTEQETDVWSLPSVESENTSPQ